MRSATQKNVSKDAFGEKKGKGKGATSQKNAFERCILP